VKISPQLRKKLLPRNGCPGLKGERESGREKEREKGLLR
jgi:hypothetical protein